MVKLLKSVHLLLLLFSLLTAGCLKKPYFPGRDPGELKVRLVLAEEAGVISTATVEIDRILIHLLHNGGKITRTEEIRYGSGRPLEAHFSSLYPGKWEVVAEAYDEEDIVVLYCSREVNIEPGSSTATVLHLTAAPGFLDVTFDASEIPEFGTEITEGKFYAYLDPQTNRSTSFPLTRNGNLLTGLIKLPAGTFQVRVVLPQITHSVYESPYYTIHIISGRTSALTIGPDEELIMEGVLDFPPETPGGLNLIPEEYSNQDGSITLHLSWEEVTVIDLAGYRLYRTNNEGRFIHLTEVDCATLTHTDTVENGDYYREPLGYAVSSFDRGGNESLWSEPVYLAKPEKGL